MYVAVHLNTHEVWDQFLTMPGTETLDIEKDSICKTILHKRSLILQKLKFLFLYIFWFSNYKLCFV